MHEQQEIRRQEVQQETARLDPREEGARDVPSDTRTSLSTLICILTSLWSDTLTGGLADVLRCSARNPALGLHYPSVGLMHYLPSGLLIEF